MSRFWNMTLGILLIAGCNTSASHARELTIERITSAPYLGGTPAITPVWSKDSQNIAFLWNDQATAGRDIWVSTRDGGGLRRITHLADEDRHEPQSVSEVSWGPSSEVLIFSAKNGLHRIHISGGDSEQIISGDSPIYAIRLSPDGRFLSFLRDGDLWLQDQSSGFVVQATNVAQPKIGNSPLNTCCGLGFSRLDVEISGYTWSPDSSHLALEFHDRSQVRQIIIPDYLGEETRAERLRRDFPGDNDHIRDLAIYSVREGRLWRLNLPDNTARTLAKFTWSPSGDRVLIDQFSQTAEHRWIYVVDREHKALQQVWHDHRPTRTTQAWNSVWHSDGQGIVFISDMDGRHHLYALRLTESKPTQLTRGEWSVVGESGSAWLGRHGKQIFFISNQNSPYERHVHKIHEEGGTSKAITAMTGVYHPTLSPDGSRVALLHSNDLSPTELYIANTNERGQQVRVTHSPPVEFNEYEWVEPRYITFKSHIDGATLHGKLLEPRNLDPSVRHPVILGPVYPNTVRARWGDRQEWRGLNNLIQQYMVLEKGYIVFQVDVRGSFGYGNNFRDKLKRDYGGIDIEDLHSGVLFLQSLSYVDPSRIGIWGTSYGGLMTAMSLFKKPGLYRAGVAASPATDVSHAMTGQVNVAGRPNTHPEVHYKTSAYNFAQNLEDELMLLHGMQDSIVLFKDSVQLAEKLLQTGKDFEFVVLPSAVHEWSTKDYNARYGLTRIVDFFDKALKNNHEEPAE